MVWYLETKANCGPMSVDEPPLAPNGGGKFPVKVISNQEILMLSIFRRLMKNEQGATAIEYTLIASLISVAAIVSMTSVGGKISNVLSNVANAMT
jgi:pilus assembly protein Flp/PilA